jgi:hypothetical protein
MGPRRLDAFAEASAKLAAFKATAATQGTIRRAALSAACRIGCRLRQRIAWTTCNVSIHAISIGPENESPGRGDIEHWYSNAESYFLIGDAMGKAMKQLSK